MRWRVGAAVLLTAQIGTGAVSQEPVPVSPGGPEGVGVVADRCPTFLWTETEGADTISLVVYRVSAGVAAEPPEKVLSLTLPGSAHGWTPSLESCLQPGEDYAWSVRSTVAGEPGGWSDPVPFRVSEVPSVGEVQRAMAILQRYLESEGASVPPVRPSASSEAGLSTLPVGGTPPSGNPTGGVLAFDTTGVRVDLTSGSHGAAAGVHAVVDSDETSWAVVAEGVGTFGGGLNASSQNGVGIQSVGNFAGIVTSGLTGLQALGTSYGGRFFGIDGASGGQAIYGTSELCCSENAQNAHTAWLKGTGGVFADVLALENDQTSTPTSSMNFITFFGQGTIVGEIEGNGSGGVQLTSAASDFAEYLPRLDAEETLEPADVVGLFSGRVSRRTHGADRIMVVSTGPIVSGGRPEPEKAHLHAQVAFLGRVPVRVRGPISTGDLLVPSGVEDGTAVALASDAFPSDRARLVIGRALQSLTGSGEGKVFALVGLPQPFAGVGVSIWELRLQGSLLGVMFLAGVALTLQRWRR